MTKHHRSTLAIAILLAAASCGGDDGGTGATACEGPRQIDSDSFFPLAVGNSWSYQVTDTSNQEMSTKAQSLTEETTPEGQTEPVFIQETTKPQGKTVSWLRREGTAIVRLQQEDIDELGALQQTTRYEPHVVRIDEDPEKTAEGASWTETYDKIVSEVGGPETTESVTEEVSVLSANEECPAPLGTFTCIHIKRVRTVGGVANKDFYFAKGIGKVIETGEQVEQLAGCELQ